MHLSPGGSVRVVPPAIPTMRMDPPAPPSVTVVSVIGPQGPQGPEGPIGNGINWHSGEGPPPEIVVGAGVGDLYLDTVSGLLYRLN